jgi:hypothetical protein
MVSPSGSQLLNHAYALSTEGFRFSVLGAGSRPGTRLTVELDGGTVWTVGVCVCCLWPRLLRDDQSLERARPQTMGQQAIAR